MKDWDCWKSKEYLKSIETIDRDKAKTHKPKVVFMNDDNIIKEIGSEVPPSPHFNEKRFSKIC